MECTFRKDGNIDKIIKMPYAAFLYRVVDDRFDGVSIGSTTKGAGELLLRRIARKTYEAKKKLVIQSIPAVKGYYLRLGFHPQKSSEYNVELEGDDLLKFAQDRAQLSFVNMEDSIANGRLIAKRGGIDLTSNKFLQTQNQGEGIKFHLDPAMLQQLQDAPGFTPVIINMRPMTDLRLFWGWLTVKLPNRWLLYNILLVFKANKPAY